MTLNVDERHDSAAIKSQPFAYVVAVAFVALKVLLLVGLAWNSFFVMDEFQHAGYARYFDYGLYDVLWPFKTVLWAGYYRLSHALANDATQLVRMARLQTIALALAMLALVYRITRNTGRSSLHSLFAVAVVLSFSTFMERSFRIRAEPIAVVFGLAAVWAVCRSRMFHWHVFAAGILSGAAFLSTQKAVYLNLALGLGLVANALAARSVRRAAIQGAVLLGGWTLTLLIYAVAFRGTDVVPVLSQVFGKPVSLAVHGAKIYPNIGGFITQTLERNVLPYALCGLGWILATRRVLGEDGPSRVLWVFSAVITACVFNHTQPWPYVFVMVIPCIGPWAAEVPEAFRSRSEQAVALAFFALLALSFPRNIKYLDHGNGRQLETVATAEALLGPDDVYMDGVGMVPTRQVALAGAWWDRPHVAEARQNPAIIEDILDQTPKLWILNYRTDKLDHLLSPVFDRSYVPVATNVLLSGAVIDGEREVTFDAVWEGDYRIYTLNGKPADVAVEVDGDLRRGVVSIERGAHRLRVVEPGASYVLLPADVPEGLTIPPQRPRRKLFRLRYRI